MFHRLGNWLAGHPWRVVAAWTLAVGLGAWGSSRFDGAAQNGTSGLYGSASYAVDRALATEFSNPFLQPLVVVASAPALDVDGAALAGWTREAAAALRALPGIAAVADHADAPDPQLRSPDGHLSILLVGLEKNDVPSQQRAVPLIRAALAPWRGRLQALDPHAVVAVTGGPAVDYDINTSSAEGGDRAEKRALPLTLGILVLAFGTLVAAALPFLMGLATTTVSLGLAFVLARMMPVSNLLGNVVTMIGLAVGIDYSLLLVKDFRERRLRLAAREAVAETVAEAGTTILWSGSTVAIGLLGLLWSPILETRSVGIGGALVVVVSVLAALTLLPASLMLLGPLLERWPILRRAGAEAAAIGRWERLALWIVRRPLRVLLVSVLAVALLALPVLGARSGFSEEPWFIPKKLESRIGADLLAAARPDEAQLASRILLRSTDGRPLAAPDHRAAVAAYLAGLHRDARIGRLVSSFEGAGAGTAGYLSHDGRAALLEVMPAHGLDAAQAQRLARDLSAVAPGRGLSATIGGATGYNNDFGDLMWRSFPRVFGFVTVSTLVLLFAAFRSYLLPLKAVLANLLAIAAGLGAVTAVFQFGWLHALVGLERPFASIPLEVPLMIFCLSFGLSMDYELFLLFRIQREFAAHGDNDRATVRGLAAVGPVITGAGLIMTAVFGAFVTAELPALKMIGVGLCVAVLVDSSVIRAFVVPAFMSVAGRWNWVPGVRRRHGGRLQ